MNWMMSNRHLCVLILKYLDDLEHDRATSTELTGNYRIIPIIDLIMKDEIIIYRLDELAEHIEVRLDADTVWLNQEQLTQLFQRDQSVISRHIRNVFKEGELDEKSNMQKMHIPNSDKPVAFYNKEV